MIRYKLIVSCDAKSCTSSEEKSFNPVRDSSETFKPPFDWTQFQGMHFCPKHRINITVDGADYEREEKTPGRLANMLSNDIPKHRPQPCDTTRLSEEDSEIPNRAYITLELERYKKVLADCWALLRPFKLRREEGASITVVLKRVLSTACPQPPIDQQTR